VCRKDADNRRMALQVTTDGPLQVRLAGCHRSASVG
jgi:hypothetical protein